LTKLNIIASMSKEYLGRTTEQWEDVVATYLDMNPLNFDELTAIFGFQKGPASEQKGYHFLLEIVSRMQESKRLKLGIGTAISSTKGFVLYRKDQEKILTIADNKETHLLNEAVEEGFVKENDYYKNQLHKPS